MIIRSLHSKLYHHSLPRSRHLSAQLTPVMVHRNLAVSGAVQLFPRRKQGDSTESKPARGRRPIVIRREEILALISLGSSQGWAAGSLGLSLTAFKQTCRTLGVARWPYKRPLKKIKANQNKTTTPTSVSSDEDAKKFTAHDLCWVVDEPAETRQDISDVYSSDDLGWLVGHL